MLPARPAADNAEDPFLRGVTEEWPRSLAARRSQEAQHAARMSLLDAEVPAAGRIQRDQRRRPGDRSRAQPELAILAECPRDALQQVGMQAVVEQRSLAEHD